MLEHRRRKAMAAIGDISHRASLPVVTASGLSGYPDIARAPHCSECTYVNRAGPVGHRRERSDLDLSTRHDRMMATTIAGIARSLTRPPSHNRRAPHVGQTALLPSAGLIAGRGPAIKSGALSRLHSPRLTGRNPLPLFGPRTVLGQLAMPRRRPSPASSSRSCSPYWSPNPN